MANYRRIMEHNDAPPEVWALFEKLLRKIDITRVKTDKEYLFRKEGRKGGDTVLTDVSNFAIEYVKPVHYSEFSLVVDEFGFYHMGLSRNGSTIYPTLDAVEKATDKKLIEKHKPGDPNAFDMDEFRSMDEARIDILSMAKTQYEALLKNIAIEIAAAKSLAGSIIANGGTVRPLAFNN